MLPRWNKITLITLAFLPFFTGCTSTEVHTFRNEALIGKYYDRILLVVDIPDANDRSITESIFQRQFLARGLDIILASNLMPNIHSMQEHELLTILERQDIHSVLTMTPAPALDLLSDRDTAPRFRSPKLQWANDLLYFNNPNPVYPEGKDLYNTIYGKFSFKLIDLDSGKVAWLGISLTERDGLGNFACMIEDNVKKTVKRLTEEKLIMPMIAAD